MAKTGIVMLAIFWSVLQGEAKSYVWQFEQGDVNSGGTTPVLGDAREYDGLGMKSAGGQFPTLAATVPAPIIWDGFLGAALNTNNVRALFCKKTNPASVSKDGGFVGITNAYAFFRSESSPTNVRPFTLEMFAKVNSFSNQWTDIFGLMRSNGNVTVAMQIRSSGDLQVRFDYNAVGTTNFSPGWNKGRVLPDFTFTNQAWHHLAIVYNGATRLRCYMDHKLLPEGDVAVDPLVLEQPYARLNLGWGNDNVGQPFDGFIDEARLTEGELSPDQFLHAGLVTNAVEVFYPLCIGGTTLSTIPSSLDSSAVFSACATNASWAVPATKAGTLLFNNTTYLVTNVVALAGTTKIQIPALAFSTLQAFTMECVAKLDSVATSGTLLAKPGDWQLTVNAGVLALNGETVGTQLSDLAFHHVAVVYDGAQSRVYIDRTCVATLAGVLPQMNNPFVVGENLVGQLFGLRLKDSALVPADFMVYRNRASGAQYWTFDDVATNMQAMANIDGEVASASYDPDYSGKGMPYKSSEKPRWVHTAVGPYIWNSNAVFNARNRSAMLATNTVDENSQLGTIVDFKWPTNQQPQRITVETFVKSARLVKFAQIVGKMRGGNVTWMIDTTDTGRARIRLDTGSDADLYAPNNLYNGKRWNQTCSGSTVIMDGQWHHVALTFNGEGSNRVAKLYVDYKQEGINTGIYSNLFYTAEPVRVGDGAGRAFDGVIDDVRITPDVLEPKDFMRVFTPAEVVHGLWLLNGIAGTECYEPAKTWKQQSVDTGVADSDVVPDRAVQVKDGTKRYPLRKSVALNHGTVRLPCAAFLGATNFTAELFVRGNAFEFQHARDVGGACWKIEKNSAGFARARFTTQAPNLTWPQGAKEEVLTTSVALDAATWYHLALTYESITRSATLWVDGEAAGSLTLSQPLAITTSPVTIAGDALIFGARFADHVVEPVDFLQAIPLDATILIVR